MNGLKQYDQAKGNAKKKFGSPAIVVVETAREYLARAKSLANEYITELKSLTRKSIAELCPVFPPR